MNFPNIAFIFVYVAYFVAIVGVLYKLRREPMYEPRVLFSLSASLWLLIIHGYLINFDGYLAAKPGLYHLDIRLLSAIALGLMLIGYLSFVVGATLGRRLVIKPALHVRDNSILIPVCIGLFGLSIANFMANVMVVSGGNLFAYLSNFAVRPHELKSGTGLSASGYLLGFIGIQVITYVVASRETSRRIMMLVYLGILTMLIVRFSQGRIFQTLVLLGVCYTTYAMGKASREGATVPWGKQVYLLGIMGFVGIGIYFLRLASALNHMGITVSAETAKVFSSSFVHFALERGNVPNFPIVFTIFDKMPYEQDFFYGSTLFNWALFFIPKSLLKADYLISLRIKDIWYQDVDGGGLPPTAVGEWYANFGFSGVIFGMFIVGLIMGSLYKRALISKSPYATVLWANMAFGFIVIYPKTDLAQVPVFSLFIIFSLWALMKLLRSSIVGRGQRT